MDVHITARHFRAHDSLRTYAAETIKRLEKYYNGIVRADVILSYEKAVNSVKVVEVHVSVYGTVLTTVTKTDDFEKAIDSAVDKIERQIKKYKSKQREKKKVTIRRTQAKV